MNRVKNWDIRLEEWAEGVTGEPFVWGETDCASLVKQAIEVVYGRVPWCPGCVPDYDSESSALRALAETGGVEDVLRENGAEEHPIQWAQNADILIGEEDNGMPTAGVVVGGQSIAAEVGQPVERRDLPYDADLYVLRL